MANQALNTNDFSSAGQRAYWIVGQQICKISGRRFVAQLQRRLQNYVAGTETANLLGVPTASGPRPMSAAMLSELRARTFVDAKWGPETSLVLWNIARRFLPGAPVALTLVRMAAGTGPVSTEATRFAIAVAYYMPTGGTVEEQGTALLNAFESIELRASDVDVGNYPTASSVILPPWNRSAPTLSGESLTDPPACSPFEREILGEVTFTPAGSTNEPATTTTTTPTPPAAPAPSYEDDGDNTGVVIVGGVAAALAAALGWRYLRKRKQT